eukprot:6194878-Pleurochrysis_carterae.AAC.1
MSVNHAVQWEVEEAMGVPETIISIMKALREGKRGTQWTHRKIRNRVWCNGTGRNTKRPGTGRPSQP